MPHPTIRLQPARDRRLRAGHPWAFANDLQLDAAAKALARAASLIWQMPTASSSAPPRSTCIP
jgi:hypothetical protein